MYLQSNEKSECCGCTACASVCPMNCLEMKADEYGFMFPTMKEPEACIHCNRCVSVCPFEKNKAIQAKEQYGAPDCYYGWHRSEEVRSRSTSGAAFIAICEACEEQGYSLFFGSQYDENLMAIHGSASATKDLSKFVTSKYVQSNLLDIFKQVLEQLKLGKRLVFSGTPCQVEGLQNFIPVKYRDQLVTIALVCHGVSSPEGYKKYLSEIEKQEKSKIASIRFRDKREKDGALTHRFTTLTMENGNVLADTENQYTVAFGLGLMHRESCHKCPYATPYRSCDFTIGDFWGIEDYLPELRPEISKGISLVYAHSDRAKQLVSSVEKHMSLIDTPLEYSLHIRQQQLRMPFARNPRRDGFLKKVVIEGKPFVKTATYEIQRHRYINFAKRVLKLITKGSKRRIV